MGAARDYAGQDCSLARTLELVGERWSLLIIRDAFFGVRRYNDFLAHLDLPRAVLADRLALLVAHGILAKHRYQLSPPREEYLLTDKGRELWPALYALAQWGERHTTATEGRRRVYRHVDCGAEVDPTGSCPNCARWIPPEDLELSPGPGILRPRTDPISRALEQPHRLLEPLTS